MMVFKPGEKTRLLCAGEPRLIYPCIVGAHVRIDQGSGLVLRLHERIARKQLLHRSVALACGKSCEECKWLGAMQAFTRSPLDKRCAVDLASGSLGEYVHLKVAQGGVNWRPFEIQVLWG